MEYQSLLLLLVLAATVFSVRSKCPSREYIYPCECHVEWEEHMTLKCKDRKTTLTDLKSALSYFSKEEKLVEINLENLALGTLPSNLFDGLTVKNLYITDCEIDFEVGEPPFKGLEDSLQKLLIHSSLTQKNDPLNLKFGHLEDLELLRIAYNKITELGDDVFTNGNSNLHSLAIRNNGLEKVGEKAFEKLENLQYFVLSGNKFGSLRRNMIPTSAKHLYGLDLSNNGLSDLPEDIFTSLPSLESLYLSENTISTIDQNTWESIVEQLNYVDLRANPLQCDSDMEWLFGNVRPSNFHGSCAGPEGKEGLSLENFLGKRKAMTNKSSST